MTVIAATEVDPYLAALIGAGAAIIGGAIVAGSNLLTTWFQRKHERELQRARDDREMRQAGRVVLEELAEIERMLLRSAATQLTWKSDERQLPAYAWDKYREKLAAHVSDEAWRWVAHAYDSANEANWNVIDLEKEYGGAPGKGPIAFIDKAWVKDTFLVVHEAMTALERALGPSGGIYRYTGHAPAEEIWERADEV